MQSNTNLVSIWNFVLYQPYKAKIFNEICLSLVTALEIEPYKNWNKNFHRLFWRKRRVLWKRRCKRNFFIPYFWSLLVVVEGTFNVIIIKRIYNDNISKNTYEESYWWKIYLIMNILVHIYIRVVHSNGLSPIWFLKFSTRTIDKLKLRGVVASSQFFRGRVLPPLPQPPPTDGVSGYNQAHSIQYSRIKSQKKNLLRDLMYFYLHSNSKYS